MAKILSVDISKCTGCKSCELACSMRNYEEYNPSKACIQAVIHLEDAVFVPVVCFQCEEPMCGEVCPSGAISRDPVMGIVRVDKNRCVGCKMCTMACPFGAIAYLPSEGVVNKCQLCGGEPECVLFCAPKALSFSELDQASLNKRRNLSKKLMEAYKEAQS